MTLKTTIARAWIYSIIAAAVAAFVYEIVGAAIAIGWKADLTIASLIAFIVITFWAADNLWERKG